MHLQQGDTSIWEEGDITVWGSQSLDKLLPLINWEDIESAARAQFPTEYRGAAPPIDENSAGIRLDWILKQIYEQLFPLGVQHENGASEAGVIVNALREMFSVWHGARPLMPRDRDFCEATLVYAYPFRAFHDELVRLIVNEVKA